VMTPGLVGVAGVAVVGVVGAAVVGVVGGTVVGVIGWSPGLVLQCSRAPFLQ
jgi:hypothetical protein